MTLFNTVRKDHIADPDFHAKSYRYKTARVATTGSKVFAYGEYVSIARVGVVGVWILFVCRREDNRVEKLFDYELGEFCL